MKLIDISIPLDPGTTTYPGDEPPALHWPGWHHDKGDPANVGFYRGGVHHGTHVDAPWHFVLGGKRIPDFPLERWIGEAQVMDLRGVDRISAELLSAQPVDRICERLLFKTDNSRDEYWRRPFNPSFVHIDASAARWCVDHGVKLVGLDYLTIDPPSEPTFPAHHILLGHEVLILENICLAGVPAGEYLLSAAPIRLTDADGAWCRAYLMEKP